MRSPRLDPQGVCVCVWTPINSPPAWNELANIHTHRVELWRRSKQKERRRTQPSDGGICCVQFSLALGAATKVIKSSSFLVRFVCLSLEYMNIQWWNLSNWITIFLLQIIEKRFIFICVNIRKEFHLCGVIYWQHLSKSIENFIYSFFEFLVVELNRPQAMKVVSGIWRSFKVYFQHKVIMSLK